MRKQEALVRPVVSEAVRRLEQLRPAGARAAGVVGPSLFFQETVFLHPFSSPGDRLRAFQGHFLVQASRPGGALRRGDVVVLTGIDRLARDEDLARDVLRDLAGKGIHVLVLTLDKMLVDLAVAGTIDLAGADPGHDSMTLAASLSSRPLEAAIGFLSGATGAGGRLVPLVSSPTASVANAEATIAYAGYASMAVLGALMQLPSWLMARGGMGGEGRRVGDAVQAATQRLLRERVDVWVQGWSRLADQVDALEEGGGVAAAVNQDQVEAAELRGRRQFVHEVYAPAKRVLMGAQAARPLFAAARPFAVAVEGLRLNRRLRRGLKSALAKIHFSASLFWRYMEPDQDVPMEDAIPLVALYPLPVGEDEEGGPEPPEGGVAVGHMICRYDPDDERWHFGRVAYTDGDPGVNRTITIVYADNRPVEIATVGALRELSNAHQVEDEALVFPYVYIAPVDRYPGGGNTTNQPRDVAVAGPRLGRYVVPDEAGQMAGG